jgi:mRNA-degrading endonuclease toxin of MazEF toxin-antitoxin module
MPAPLEDLERGTVCLALYPFTFGFPLETVQRDAESELLDATEHADIEQIEKTIAAGDVPEVITKIKLRRVLLIQTGAHPGMHDVMVARITSVSDSMRARAGFYGRLTGDRHPTALLLGDRPEHGTGRREAYVNLINVSPISKTAILRRVGGLDDDEMRQVTDRLLTALEMDISHRLGDPN